MMKLIIDIDEEQKKMVDALMELPPQIENDLISAIRHGTPLPKGHGDLIDRNDLLEWEEEVPSKYLYTNKMINVVDVKAAPTIIKADKEREDE